MVNFQQAETQKGPLDKGARLVSSPFSAGEMRAVAEAFGTPCYVYSQAELERRANILLNIKHAFGFTPRYAMKACPSGAVLQILNRMGIKIDSSSEYEAARAMSFGIPGTDIKLTTQEFPKSMRQLIQSGVTFNACSLHQLEQYGQLFPGHTVSFRVNPGLGSGHTNRCNTGGPASSFGIWHEQIGEIQQIAAKYDLKINALHSHIGAGTDPEVWVRAASLTLAIVEHFPEVTTVNLGGGFKVARMPEEKETDVDQILSVHIKEQFENFHTKHKRKLHLEVEPGTWMAANFGALLCAIQDKSNTGSAGYTFLKADAGMTELLRPGIYGAQHPIELVASDPGRNLAQAETEHVIVSGHCCESGDIFTPAVGDPEGLLPRELPRSEIGDLLVFGGAGAYGAGFSTVNYNSFPEAPQVLVDTSGDFHLIRVRQTLEQQLANERMLG